MTDTHSLVLGYVDHLHRALRDLPSARRKEIISEIREHIEEATGGSEKASEAEVRTVLDQLGDPETIAAEARERFDVRENKGGALEAIALVLLLIGGFIIPAAGWVIGAILLWISKVWTTRDKVIGTLFVPGGLALPLFLGTFAVGATASCEVDLSLPGPQQCVNTVSGPGILSYVLLASLVIAPIASAIYLGRQAFRRS